MAAFFPAAATASSIITKAVQNRADHFSITASAGQDGSLLVAVDIDTEKNGAVPVGAQDFPLVFRKQVIQVAGPKDVLPAGEEQQVHNGPGEEAADKCSYLYRNRVPYEFFNHGLKEKGSLAGF